jgi:transposase
MAVDQRVGQATPAPCGTSDVSRSIAVRVRPPRNTGLSILTVSLVARRHGVAPNQLFRWRKLAAQGALTATRAGDQVAYPCHKALFSCESRHLQSSLTLT